MASKFTITAELSLQTKNLNQVVRNLQSQFNNANLNIKIKDLAQAQSHIQKISSSSRQASKDVGVLGNSMEQAFKRFTVITAVTGTLIAFTRAVKNSISEAITFEREVVKIAQATGQTVSQLKGLTREIDSVSTTFGVASEELILAARSLTQAGFAADKVAGSLKVLAQTELAATFDSIQDTTEGAIALLNQFGRQAQRTGSEVKFLEQSFSAINQVSKEFAVESSDLVTAIRTTGAAFESAGGDLNELLALFTSVRSTTRESAESIATGFRTIFTRVQRVDTINTLRDLGIELQDTEGKFIGPMEAVKRLSTALNTIDPKDFRFNLVVEELGGFRQVSKVIPLIQQFAVTQKALNVAQNSGGSLAKDATTAQQALAVQIAKTREEFQKFMREMVASETFQSTVRTLLDLSSAFIKVADSVKPLIPLIATFGALKAGAALVPALKSFAGSGKRGGIPIGFATGGLVPGSGNGDTVPAMLTPGEFVIRKSSVNKIGADKLARMNSGGPVQRFADGGRVTLIPKPNRYGIFALEPEGEDDKDNYSTGVKVKNKDVTEQLRNRFNLPKDSEVAIGGFLKSFHIGNDAENNIRQTFKDSTEKSFSRMITDVSNDVSKKVGSKPIDIESSSLKSAITSLFNQDSKSARSAIEGYILEGVSSAISGAELAGGQERWDFPNPAASANGLAKLFGKEQEIAALNKGDVKRTDNSEARADVRSNKLARTLLENPEEVAEIVGNKAYTPKKTKTSEGTLGGIVDRLASKYEGIKFEDGSVNGAKISRSTISNIIQQIPGMRTKVGVNDPVDEKLVEFIENNIGKIQKKYLGGAIHKFASGGFASGTDTVPAMLTPGEFVVNKKSAQRIGYSNLNRMNKVGKYANGGVVQYLANGTGNRGVEEVVADARNIRFIKEAIAAEQNQLGYATVVKGKSGTVEAELKKVLAMAEAIRKAGGDVNKFLSEAVKKIKEAPNQFVIDKDIQRTYKQSISPQKDSTSEFENRIKKLSEGTGATITNLLILGGAIESVVAQFTEMDESYKKGFSAFGASISIYTAITSQLKQMGAGLALSIIKKRKEDDATDKSTHAIKRNIAAMDKHTDRLNGKSGGGKGGDSGDLESPKSSKRSGAIKALNVAESAINGFALAMSAATAITAYYTEISETSSKRLDETLENLRNNLNSVAKVDLIRQSQSKFTDAAYANSMSSLTTPGGTGMAAMAGGATAGATIGLALGPMGSAIGGFIGGLAGLGGAFLDARQTYEKNSKIIESAGEDFALGIYSSISTTKKAQEFFQNIAKKSDKDIFEQINKDSSEYLKQLQHLTDAQNKMISVYGSMEKAPEKVRKSLDDLSESVRGTKTVLDQISGEQFSRKASEIGRKIGSQDFSSGDAIDEFVKLQETGLRQTVEAEQKAQYGPRIQELKKAGFDQTGIDALEKSLKSLANIKIKETSLRTEKALLDVSIQAINQKIALEKEIRAREALVGSLNRQLALQTSFENFKLSIEENANSLSNLDAVLKGSVSGLKSSISNPNVLKTFSPVGANAEIFNRAMSDIGSIGPAGKELANNFKDLQKVLPNLRTVLGSMDLSKFQEGDKAIDKFISTLGIDTGGVVAKALKDSFSAAFSSKEMAPGGGFGDEKEQTQKILDNFENFAKNLGERGGEVLEVLQSYENRSREIYDRIMASEEQALSIRMSAIDKEKALYQNLKTISGGTMSIGENEAFRTAKRTQLVGGALANNPVGIGKELQNIRRQLLTGNNDPLQAKVLQSKAKNLETALSQLADQSEKTSDVMSKFQEIKAQRETLTSAATKYAFGTAEEKQTTDTAFQALATVFASGDINAIPDELKSSVSSLLQEFKDVPILNGMTGKQIEKELTAREFEKTGNFAMSQMLRTETSTPEQMLAQELLNIANIENASREAMLQKEEYIQGENIKALSDNTNALRDYIQNIPKIEAQLNKVRDTGIQTFGSRASVDKLESERTANVERKASIEKALSGPNGAEELSQKLGDAITKALQTYFKSIEAGQLKINPAGRAYTGGLIPNDLIYRANGGSIFKPKGTDTVPAMLSPGEYVVNSKSVSKYGSSFMDSINNGTAPKYAANGGWIDPQIIEKYNKNRQTQYNRRLANGPVSQQRYEANQQMLQNRMAFNQSIIGGMAAPNRQQSGFNNIPPMPNNNQGQGLGEFMNKFEETAKTMNNMTMTHQLTVDGQLNIAGIDGNAIAAQISQALGQYVGNIVQQHLNKQNRRPGT